MRRRLVLPHMGVALALAGTALLLSACGGGAVATPTSSPGPLATASTTPSATSSPVSGEGSVAVLYAGSLVNLMEHDLGPAFQRDTGYGFSGYSAGSKALANQISGKLRRADVFISASPKVNDRLMGTANGDWVRWYATFASAPLVVGYNAHSAFVNDFKTKPWYEVLAEPGIRLGRTDPQLDPKGELTIELFQRAEQYYNKPGLAQQVLAADENPSQVFPETDLVGRLQAGQLDAGFFYSNEATELNIPTVKPAEAIDPSAAFTVTVVQRGPNPQGADAFVRFLLSSEGQAILRQHGLSLVQPPRVSGDTSAIPGTLRSLLGQ